MNTRLSFKQLVIYTLGIILIGFSQNVLGLTGTLTQVSPKYLQFTTDKAMIIDSTQQIKNILTISINGVSSSSYTYNFNIKSTQMIEIYLVYTQSFIYETLTLTVAIPSAITDSSSLTLDSTTYTTYVQLVIIYTSAEQTVLDIIPYLVWGFFGAFILCAIVLLTKIDSVGMWHILEFFQICGLLNLLNVVKADPLTDYLSELDKCNFFFIPTWFYQLLTKIGSTLSTQSSSIFIQNNSIDAPSSTSFIRTTGNAIVIVFFFALFTLGFSFSACLKLQTFFNQRSLYRLLDILLVHFVFAAIINLRFYSFSSGYSISDFVLSIITILAYFFYSTIIPCLKVNKPDIVLLQKDAIEKSKHFVNKLRVEYFFSRNYFFIRTSFKMILTVGIALGTMSSTAAGVILFASLIYYLIVFLLSFKYQLYEDSRLNAHQSISTVSLFFIILVLTILWCFEQFYSMVSRSSSSQIDSSFISINHYTSWTLVCLIVVAKLTFIIFILSYFYSTKKGKFEFMEKLKKAATSFNKSSNNLQEDLINTNKNNDTIAQINQSNDQSGIQNNEIKKSPEQQIDIEMQQQPFQSIVNGGELTTVQSQVIESPSKFMTPQGKLFNTMSINENSDSILISQPPQRQFQNQVSQIVQDSQPSEFVYQYSINESKSNINNQQEQEQDSNIRFSNKTSTFSQENKNKNQA